MSRNYLSDALYLQVMFIFSILILILSSTMIYGHKDAGVTSSSSGIFEFHVGLVPTQVVENQAQKIYIEALNPSPVTNLQTFFSVYKNSADTTLTGSEYYLDELKLAEYSGSQLEPGIYNMQYKFKERGNYLVTAKIYEGKKLVKQENINIHVEPNGPSIYFWLYMLLSLIIGGIIASKGHEVL